VKHGSPGDGDDRRGLGGEYVGGRPADAELAEDREDEATERVRKKI
jgi:hypothetical protein